MKKGIAFFDFDGTITTRDTMLELIRYRHGVFRYLFGLAYLFPSLVALKLGMLSNHRAKEKMLRYFFGGMETAEFERICQDFQRELLPALIRPKALAMIKELKSGGVEVVVVSASAENWVSGWCEANGITLVASCLETREGNLTGMLKGRNCHGEEKLRRIRASYDLAAYGSIHCYGDTKGDLPMFSIATDRFYKPFR